MKEQHFEPNERTSSVMLAALTDAGLPAMRRGLFLCLEGRNLVLDTVTRNLIESACERTDHWVQALSLLVDVAQMRFRPSVGAFDAVVRHCADVHAWVPALALLDDMRLDDLRPWSASCKATNKAALETCLGKAQLDTTFSLAVQSWGLHALERLPYRVSSPAPEQCELQMQLCACAVEGKLPDAVDIFDHLRRRCVQVDSVTYHVFMLALIDSGHRKQAEKVYRQAVAEHAFRDWRTAGKNFINVHKMRVEEARLVVLIALREAISDFEESRKAQGLLINAGRGLHSHDGQAKILPALESLLRDDVGVEILDCSVSGNIKIGAQAMRKLGEECTGGRHGGFGIFGRRGARMR